MTILTFGAARCIDCKAPVAIVRRTVEVPCIGIISHRATELLYGDHTHTITDVGPFTVVDEQGERHECASVIVSRTPMAWEWSA